VYDDELTLEEQELLLSTVDELWPVELDKSLLEMLLATLDEI